MNFLKLSLAGWTLCLALLPASADAAQTPKTSRPCLVSDLVGTWELKGINSKITLNPKDPFGWPYQRFVFTERGGVKEVVSSSPIGREALAKLANSLVTSKFSLDERGILSITKLELPYPERCLCSYATEDIPPELLMKVPKNKQATMPHKGDLVLTYLSKAGEPIVAKTLRKIK